MEKYVEYCAHDERHHKIKLIIEIEKDYYEIIKYDVEHGQNYKYFEIIANGIPYEEIATELQQKEDLGKWIFHEDFHESIRYGCNQCGNLRRN